MADAGMVPSDEWTQTEVHKASAYSCGKCGEGFGSPEQVYAHLDVHHSVKELRRRPKRRKAA